MTDPEARELGERWMAAGGGHPDGARLWDDTDVDEEIPRYQGRVYCEDGAAMVEIPQSGPGGSPSWRRCTRSDVPDLRDAASRGAALEIVRERYGRVVIVQPLSLYLHTDALMMTGPRKGRRAGRDGWGAYGTMLDVLPCGASEEEALVAALEAAP